MLVNNKKYVKQGGLRMSDVMADRTPPHNIEAEQAVLGAILIDQDALTSASELLVPDSFYRTKHQKIFEVMLGLSDKGNQST